jgi:hypothetical protein
MSSDYLSPRLYHFRPDKGGRDLETLLNSSMYFASVNSFNDPFECAAAKSENPEYYWNGPLESLQAVVAGSGVCCFCRSFSNPLLWSHYANSHQGFSIGVSRQALVEQFGDLHVREVLYEDAVPSLDDFGWMDMSLVMLCTKPTCWSYEQEVRVIRDYRGNDTVGLSKIETSAIREIIFGMAMQETRRLEIQKQIRDKEGFSHVKFASMERIPGRYGVARKWLPEPEIAK